MTRLPGTSSSTSRLVCLIMARPVAVTLAAMGTHGIMPLVAPSTPYTEFMVTLNALCLLQAPNGKQFVGQSLVRAGGAAGRWKS